MANSSLPAETLENAYDELSKQIKQLKTIIDTQCVKIPVNRLTSTTAATGDIQSNYVFKVNSSGDQIVLGPSPSATVYSTGIGNIVEDLTPQLGGDLEAGSNWIKLDSTYGIKDENDNEQVVFTTTTSAVNYMNIINSATGNGVQLKAAGGDTNIDIYVEGKGTGSLKNTTGISTTSDLSATGDIDFGSSTSLKIPHGATPTISAAGHIAVDTTVASHDSLLAVHDGTNSFFVPMIRQADLSTTDNDVVVYDSAASRFKMESQSGSGSGGALVLIQSQTASASSTIDFTTLNTGTYDELILIGSAISLSGTTVDLEVVFSTDGGSTYISSGYHYCSFGFRPVGTWYTDAGYSQTQFVLVNGSDFASKHIGFNIQLSNLSRPFSPSFFMYSGSCTVVGDSLGVSNTLSGSLAASADVDAIRIRPSTGTISQGAFRLYGIKKS